MTYVIVIISPLHLYSFRESSNLWNYCQAVAMKTSSEQPSIVINVVICGTEPYRIVE